MLLILLPIYFSFSKSVAHLNLQVADLEAAKAELEQETLRRAALEQDLASTRDQLDDLRTTTSNERKKQQQQAAGLKSEKEAAEQDAKEAKNDLEQAHDELKELTRKLEEVEESWEVRCGHLEEENRKWQSTITLSVVPSFFIIFG